MGTTRASKVKLLTAIGLLASSAALRQEPEKVHLFGFLPKRRGGGKQTDRREKLHFRSPGGSHRSCRLLRTPGRLPAFEPASARPRRQGGNREEEKKDGRPTHERSI